jgi:hypothetical protein
MHWLSNLPNQAWTNTRSIGNLWKERNIVNMHKLLSSRFNIRTDPPKIGITSTIWKTGIFLSITGFVFIFVGGVPAIINVLRFGLATETPRTALSLIQFGFGVIAGGADVALVAYLLSGFRTNQQTGVCSGRSNRRLWYIAGIVSLIFAPLVVLLDSLPWLIVVPIILGTLLVLAFEIMDSKKAKEQAPKI